MRKLAANQKKHSCSNYNLVIKNRGGLFNLSLKSDGVLTSGSVMKWDVASIYKDHRRKIKTEAKAKVVVCLRDDLKHRMNCTTMISRK